MANNSRLMSLQNKPFVHIMVEGIDDIQIFKDKRNKERYKSTIKKYSEKYSQVLLGYTILNNCAHMIYKLDSIDGLSTCIKSINLSYSQNYNKQNKRSGVLFKGRFKSEPVSSTKELLGCLSFIHNIPVTEKTAIFAEEYLYSSANDYALRKSDMVNLDVIKDIYGEIPTIPTGTNIKFLSSDSEHYENINLVLTEIVKRYNIKSVEQFNKDTFLLYLICKELRVRTKCSLREIAEHIHVSREKVRRIMKYKFL